MGREEVFKNRKLILNKTRRETSKLMQMDDMRASAIFKRKR